MSHLVEEAIRLGARPLSWERRMFTDEQNQYLKQPLDRSHVKQRPGPGGKKLSYIEGYTAIRAANEAFGFDGWSYEVRSIQPQDGGMTAIVRVSVGDVMREDVGWGDGNPELAHKEAVTDALKRALRSFGDRFGLDLYDKESELHQPAKPAPKAAAKAEDLGKCEKHDEPWVRGQSGKVGHVLEGGQPCMKEVAGAQ